MNHFLRVLLLVAIVFPLSVLLSGCGAEHKGDRNYSAPRAEASKTMNSEARDALPADASLAAKVDNATGFAKKDSKNTVQTATRQVAPGQAAGGEEKSPTPRKIIYNATVNLVVEDFEKVRGEVPGLVQKFGGFVANSNFQGTAGSSRSGVWTVRVPVAEFGGFVDAISDLGTIENQNTSSKEVTEEFYDVEARIRNKQQEEERLLAHLKEHTGKLEEILQVEREISRVREEIERLQGRMRVLTNLTDLTTVTLHIQERTKFIPIAQAPTFATRISETFGETINAMVSVGQALVLLFVATGPWMAVLAIPGILIYALLRRRTTKRTTVRS